MKALSAYPLVSVLALTLLGASSEVRADVSIRVGVNHGHHHGHGGWRDHHRHWDHHRHHSHWRHHGRHHHIPSYRYVTIHPVVVPQPYYVPAPTTVPLSGNYGQDLADFKERHTRLRTLVQRQRDKGGIGHDDYDRFMIALDGLEREQRERSFNRGGNLTPQDFQELHRRLDQIDEDIERILSA
jgi:hypothetical protein